MYPTASPVAERFPAAPYPTGWFRVAASRDLAPGDVKPLRYFGQDLVLFRTASGDAKVLDGHCPHLGAHLGHGGRVSGDCVVCPFHGWQFDGDGQCRSVPLANKIPPLAKTRAWPVRERAGVIFAWHHPERLEPTWEPPALEEHDDPAWTRYAPAQHWVMRTHAGELAENATDNAHFPYLHTHQMLAMRTEEAVADGPVFVHRSWQQFNLFGIAKLLSKEVTGTLTNHIHGIGIVINRAVVKAQRELSYSYVFFITPIDAEHIDVHSVLSVRRIGGPVVTWLLGLKAKSEGRKTIEQDIPIWENKKFRTRPVLSDADGPIMAYRKWSKQFYPTEADPARRPLAVVNS